MVKTSTVIGVTAATLLSAGAAYAAWFDYRRRTDANFRKSLRKQSKKASKAGGSSSSLLGGAGVPRDVPRSPAERAAAIDRAYNEVKSALKDGPPKDFASIRSYFDQHIALGEALTGAGPPAYFDAAVAFLKALQVYAEPAELLELYSKVLNPAVFTIVVEILDKDSTKASGTAPGAKLGDIDDDDAPTASTSAPAPVPEATTPAEASTTAPAPAPAATPASAPAETTAPSDLPTQDTGATAATSVPVAAQTSASSPASVESLPTRQGPSSTTSSQEWEAVSVSSATAPVSSGLAATTAPAQSQPQPTPSSDAPVFTAPSHTAAPVLSEVDAVADETEQAPAPEAQAEDGTGELEELEPDAVGESVSDVQESASSLPTASTASATDSWTSLGASTTQQAPRSPSMGGRDQPRWS
ncbi:mitochondrial import receptor subunit tom20 [Tilletia horrida]|uniref:Mitochondrial import receptor subunit tom20 n=1 Tax=Tilletia horrida TaxID=155126 RepID=A0AAN6JSD4_9BASI|nr:mitochondrial import receptor subunit tom20 [Tilletia horrida]KAK0552002.1 mitochondrial import receptor subunit tom20 [Tilletia horrida]KAK0566153.1 mitochondrial import receptor subunit tom20 [Tilletia horrida]